METSPAILLRKYRYSDTSLIVAWLTSDSGLIRTLAKGALRPKSAFAGRLDLFFECEIQFARSRRGDLHTLAEATLTHPHPGIRTTYARTRLAAYFVELIELASEPDHPSPGTFDLLRRGLEWIGVATPSSKGLLHFERELATILGLHHDRSDANPHLEIARIAGRLPKEREELLRDLPRG